uniref:Transcriptional regulator n=2 Tax=Burkholderiaceae TaxID=119060 RepID=Q46UY9_CUPPJ
MASPSLLAETMNDIPETSALARHDARGYGIAVLPISFFRQSEEVDMEGVWILTELIASDGCWLAPIPVEASHGIVMDGNHRLRAAMRLGLKCLPCIPLCYGDARICVRDWHSGEPFDTRCILHTVAAGALLPHKSTRHFFEPSLPRTSIPLERLRTQGR